MVDLDDEQPIGEVPSLPDDVVAFLHRRAVVMSAHRDFDLWQDEVMSGV